jgi:hypothetical protein
MLIGFAVLERDVFRRAARTCNPASRSHAGHYDRLLVGNRGLIILMLLDLLCLIELAFRLGHT